MPGLKFRVLLDSIKEKEIFRDIVVNDSSDFETFYKTIIAAFDFSNDQMASFFVSDHDWNKGKEITLVDMGFDEESQAEIMSENIIRTCIESPKQRFILVYDFLNMWIFLIELQEVVSEEVSEPKVVLEVGKVTEEMKKSGEQSNQNLEFETERLDDFGDFDDDYSSDDFENIDDLDI